MKKPIVKKILIAVAILLVAALITGGVILILKNKNKLSDNEAEKILSELLPKAEKVNEIIWGEGLPVAEGQDGIIESVTGPQYRLVDSSCGYSNTEDIAKAVAEVYSTSYIENDLNKILFEGDTEDVRFMLYQRYKNNDDGNLIINIVQKENEYVGQNKIDPSTVKVTGVNFDEVYLSVEQTLFDGSTAEIKLTLVKEKSGWRLNDPTY